MTQAAVSPWKSYVATGALTDFAYPFRVGAATDLEVYVDDVLSTAYTVTGVGSPTGGLVQFLAAPAADSVVHLRRVTPQTQETDYQTHDPFGAEMHEAALDKLTRQVQDLEERVSRSLTLPVTAPVGLRHLRVPVPGAGQLLGWAADGSGWALYPSGGGVTSVTLQGPAKWVDVTRAPYNADPTGSAVATTAIQEAMEALAAAGGGVVWLPGIFAIDATLTVPRGVSLLGGGSSGQAAAATWPENVYPSTLRWTGVAGGTMLTCADHWAHRMEGLTLDGNTLAQTLLFLDRSPRGGLFRDVILRRSAAGAGGAALYLGWPAEALALFPPSSNVFERVFFLDIGAKALLLDGSAHNRFVSCGFNATDDDTVLIITPDNGSVPQEGNDDNCFYGCGLTAGPGHYGVVNNFTTSPQGGYLNNWTDCAFLGGAGATLLYAANNLYDSYYTRCYLYTSETVYTLDTGGKLVLRDCLFNTASGRPSPFAITPTGSPFAYTNTTPYRLVVNLVGGTIAGLSVVRNGVTVGLSLPTVVLDPGDVMSVDYTDPPTISAMPQ
jgi:hypothetical protein